MFSMITATVIIVFLLALAFYVYKAQAKLKATPMVSDSEKIITLTETNFDHQTKNKLMLVDFWAAWCGPCRMMAPILNELSLELEGNQHIGKVNIEEYPSLAKRFNVRNIPTLIVFKNGVEVARIVGVRNKEYLQKQMNAHA
jgi:thioredoxin 1